MGGMSFHVAISWLLNVFSIPIILVNNTLYPYQAVTKPLITLPSPSLYTLHSGCPHLRRFAFPGFKKSLPPGPRRFTGGKPYFVLLASGQVISRQARPKRRRWRRRHHRGDFAGEQEVVGSHASGVEVGRVVRKGGVSCLWKDPA